MTEEVWLSRTSGSSVYHTNPQCRYLTETHNTRRREVVDAWDYQHCQHCQTLNER